jgi:long-subunit fatty acid transport protein
MKRFFYAILLFAAPAIGSAQSLFPDLGGQRVGISGLQFLKIPISAEQAALSGGGITTISNASSIFVNPAMSVDVERNSLSFSYSSWFAELSHTSASAVYKLSPDFALGFGFISLSTPDMPVTTVLNPDGTGEQFSYGDIAASLSIARRLTSQFSFGITGSFIQQTIASLNYRTYFLDLGVCYKVPFKGIRLGAVLQHFGGSASASGSVQTVSPSLNGVETISSFEDIDPPTIFRLAFSFEPIATDKQKLVALVQLNHPNDNVESLSFGVEYAFQNFLFLRAGYNTGREEQDFPDLGAGLRQSIGFAVFSFDYAFVNFKTLGGTHRLTVSLSSFNL